MIDIISKIYNGNIKRYEPLGDEQYAEGTVPKDLLELLKVSNGISETMVHPVTGQVEEIGWILYPLEEMIENSRFYQEEYSVKGTVFCDDGAGNPYYIKEDGKVYLFECIDNEEVCKADSLYDFYVHMIG